MAILRTRHTVLVLQTPNEPLTKLTQTLCLGRGPDPLNPAGGARQGKLYSAQMACNKLY